MGSWMVVPSGMPPWLPATVSCSADMDQSVW